MTRRAVWRHVDALIRLLAGISLVPFALLTLFLAIMAGDAPGSGPLPSVIVLSAGACIIGVLGLSCAFPDHVAGKLERYVCHARWIVRAPAYLYAPFGLYYGARIVSGIAVNLFR